MRSSQATHSEAPGVFPAFPLPRLRNLAAIVTAFGIALGGCTANTATTPATAPVAAAKSTPPPTRDFPTETLYELLLAEFAGIREQVEPALEIYTIQAHETRDPGVIERGIHIASYLRRADVVLDLAELWAEIEPDNVEVRRLLAFHLASAGRVVEAFPHGEYLLLTGDDDYLQSLAAFAQDSPIEEKQRLLSLYEELEAEHPQNPGLLLGKAMLLRQLDQLEDSLNTARALIKLEPKNETGQLLNAQLLHALGDSRTAERDLRKALKKLPESKRLRLQYARFLSQNNLAKSREQIAILARQYPEDVNIQFSLGLADKELGQLAGAKATFNRLITLDKRTSDAQYQLGKIAEEEQQPEEAVYRYRQVKDGQNLLPAAMRVAEILTEYDNLSAAREHLSTMRAIYPAVRENLYQMEAELLMLQGRLDEAYDLLSSGIALETENLNLRYARSIISAKQEDLPAVEADLRAILEIDENNATALNALGYTMLNLSSRHGEALELIEKAHELEPGNPAILDSLGWARFRMGQPEEALPYLKEAFEAFPDGEVAAHLGEVMWVLNQKQQALEVWRKGLESSPEDQTLLDTLQRLIPDQMQELMDAVAQSTQRR